MGPPDRREGHEGECPACSSCLPRGKEKVAECSDYLSGRRKLKGKRKPARKKRGDWLITAHEHSNAFWGGRKLLGERKAANLKASKTSPLTGGQLETCDLQGDEVGGDKGAMIRIILKKGTHEFGAMVRAWREKLCAGQGPAKARRNQALVEKINLGGSYNLNRLGQRMQ